MRAEARMTLDAAAVALFRTKSALHRIEKGETMVDVHVVKSMMDLYDHYDPDLIDEAVRARKPGWWTKYGVENRGYIDIESEANEVWDVALILIPGLLQIPDYTRALFEAHRLGRTKKRLENDITVRQIRQQRLTAPENRLSFDTIIDESVLRKGVGGPRIMHDQLEHLLRAATLPNVTIRVMPDTGAAHNGIGSGFTLLRFADPADPPVIYIEHPFGAVHLEEEERTVEARLTFEHLASQALSPEDTVALIERIVAE
jgi:hypothetical protein